MKNKIKFKVAFLTKHESQDGCDHSDGWQEYKVSAKNSKTAKNKAQKLWAKDHGFSKRHWIEHTIIDRAK